MKRPSLEELLGRLIQSVDRGYPLSTLSSIDEGNKQWVRGTFPQSVVDSIMVFVNRDGSGPGNKSLNGFLLESALMRLELLEYLEETKHPAILETLNAIMMDAARSRSNRRKSTIKTLWDILARHSQTDDPIEREDLKTIVEINTQSWDKEIKSVAQEILEKMEIL